MSKWYDYLGKTDEPEPVGNGFLKLANLSDSTLKSHAVRARVGNVLSHHGGAQPKKGSDQYRLMKISEFFGVLNFAAALTGNDIACVALPMDVATVRAYSLREKNFKLPPFTVTDSSSLVSTFITHVGEAYDRYLAQDKTMHNDHTPGADEFYTTPTDFNKTLRPLLGDCIRYCGKYWYLHPWLSRSQAYKAAHDHFKANFKKKGDAVKLIDAILQERKDALLLQASRHFGPPH